MTSSPPVVFDLTDPELWGVKKHNGILHIDPKSFELKPEMPVTLDVENNLDGSFAGIGLTQNGVDIVFYTAFLTFPRTVLAEYKLIGHNVKYDVQMLRKWGFAVSPEQIVWDTQAAEYVIDSTKNRYGLKDLSFTKFGSSYPDYKTLAGKGKKAVSIGTLPDFIVANYCGNDVLNTHRLYQSQLEVMSPEQIRYLEELELPTLRVLLEMEERGIQIDSGYLRSLDARLSDELSGVAASLRCLAGAEINLNSHQQIKQFLLDKAGLTLKSTAAEELKKFSQVPVVQNLLRYRELAKLKGTYTEPLIEKANGQDTYRLYARFNQCVTHTGRLSSSSPNLQNIPTRTEDGDAIRQGFVPRPGYTFVDADYSQIEPRLMAYFSQDAKLKDVFLSGSDLYDSVASFVGCDRRTAKILWLAMAYNAGAFKIAQTASISVSDAQVFLTKMKLAFQQFFYWRSKVIAQAEIDGGVTTLFGRFIPLTADLAHLAPNYKVQGSAAEIMKLAIISTKDYGPVCTVHDELIFECRDAESVAADVKRLMSSVVELDVPLAVDVGSGNSWKEAKQ